MKEVAASILGKENKAELVNELLNKGLKFIHYDVMDGKFVSNTSLPLDEVESIFANTKPHYKDVHLMVEKPFDYVKRMAGKADQISVHIETVNEEELERIFDIDFNNTKIGLVLNPDTPVSAISKYLPRVHHVMIMSVVPGKGGQTFIESSLDKIKQLKKEIEDKNLNVMLEIDGGINNQWGPVVFKEGINLAVSGSYLINNINDGSLEKLLK